MKLRVHSSIVVTIYAGICCTLALWVLPKFRDILADMLPNDSLPVAIRALLSAGPGACLLSAFCSAGFIAISDQVNPPRWKQAIMFLFTLPVWCIVVFGYWSFIRLVETAD